jgi:hypothetical protein
VNPAGCLVCTVPASCPVTSCPISTIGTSTVEDATCPFFPGTSVPFKGAQVTVTTDSTCQISGYLAAGVAPLGNWRMLSTYDYLGDFPGLGGLCTGAQLPTGALRIVFNCPDCQFVIGP